MKTYGVFVWRLPHALFARLTGKHFLLGRRPARDLTLNVVKLLPTCAVQLVSLLQIHPEFSGRAEILGRTQSAVDRDAALPFNNRQNTICWYSQRSHEGIGQEPRGLRNSSTRYSPGRNERKQAAVRFRLTNGSQ